MLRSIKQLYGNKLGVSDGKIARVNLPRQLIENGPRIESHKPVSRQIRGGILTILRLAGLYMGHGIKFWILSLRAVCSLTGLIGALSIGSAQVARAGGTIALSDTLSFGNVTVDSFALLPLTITNLGDSDLVFTNIEFPTGFTASTTAGVLAPGMTTNVIVIFFPTDTIDYSAPVTVDSDSTSGINTVIASGMGKPNIDMNFGGVQVGLSRQLILSINNGGNATLTISNITFPPGFSGDFSSGTIAAGAAQNVTVTFSPVVAQPYSGTVRVASDSTSGAHAILVSGDGFQYATAKAGYSGLFYPAGNVEFSNSGYFSAQASAGNVFSARMRLAGKQYSFSGKLSGSGSFSGTIVRKGLSSLSVSLQAGFNGGDAWKGVISNATFIAALVADRVGFNSKTNPAPHAGSYPVTIAGSSNPSVAPTNNGTGTITVTTSGIAKVKATLGDGTKMSQATIVSQNGQLPFCGALYSNKGSIIGWLTLGNTPGNELNGTVDWFKPAGIDRQLPAGFSFLTTVAGAKK